jgi:hypothetical protein
MRPWPVLVVATATMLGGCAVIDPPSERPGASGTHSGTGHAISTEPPAPPAPLRAGESLLTVGVADDLADAVYRPSAPDGATDDYRCFLADPALGSDAFVTGVAFLPGNPAVVHHSILYRVDPEQVSLAEQQDAADDGPGWECFGGPGLPNPSGDRLAGLDAAPWLAGWAPGGKENVFADGYGVPLRAGSRIVVQMHYNLRGAEGDTGDNTQVRLRLTEGQDLTPMRTMLLPAPVELPCLPGESGALCNRGDAVADVARRFGSDSGRTPSNLQLLCGGDPFAPRAGETQSCIRYVREPVTIRAAAGHMHLLGREITVVANAGTSRERTVLDIPVWDFDDQGARPLSEPVTLRSGDTITVTCRHDASLRNQLPALEGTDPRYVVWGEGTTDEMCLGILIVTDPSPSG